MAACLKTLFHFEVFPMIDLNHGSGAQYTTSCATPDITTALSDAIDIGLGARHRSGYIARPDAAGEFPVVFVIQDINGMNSFEKELNVVAIFFRVF